VARARRNSPVRRSGGLHGAGSAVIEPELREGLGEIELAAAHKLPVLVQGQDIRASAQPHRLLRRHRYAAAMAEAVRLRAASTSGWPSTPGARVTPAV